MHHRRGLRTTAHISESNARRSDSKLSSVSENIATFRRIKKGLEVRRHVRHFGLRLRQRPSGPPFPADLPVGDAPAHQRGTDLEARGLRQGGLLRARRARASTDVRQGRTADALLPPDRQHHLGAGDTSLGGVRSNALAKDSLNQRDPPVFDRSYVNAHGASRPFVRSASK